MCARCYTRKDLACINTGPHVLCLLSWYVRLLVGGRSSALTAYEEALRIAQQAGSPKNNSLVEALEHDISRIRSLDR